jgi:hypothetical protein
MCVCRRTTPQWRCVCIDDQLWDSEWWSCNVLDRSMCFERMIWTRKWMSCLWSFTVFSRRLRWQIPSFLGNHMVCLWCCACMWSLHLLKLLSTLRVMLWELSDEYSITHVYRFQYFHPSETRVKRVATRSWFQDVFRILRYLQRSWTHQVFLFCNIQNLQIHKYVCRLFWMGENRVCDSGEYTKLTWPNFMVESTQSWPGQILRGDLRKRIPMMYKCCYIENFFEDVDDHDTCDWKNQLVPVWEYRSDSRIHV